MGSLGTAKDDAQRPPVFDMLCGDRRTNHKPPHGQKNTLGELVNRVRHAAYAVALDQLLETETASKPNNSLGG